MIKPTHQSTISSISAARSRPASLLLEAILGIALFGIFVAAFGTALLNGEESTKAAGDRVRGAHFSQEAIEAVKSIRDESFSNLIAGRHGVAINPVTNKWTLSGSQNLGSGGYITSVTIAFPKSDTAVVTASTSWKRAPNRPNLVSLSTVLTKWQQTQPVGNWSSMTLAGSYVDGGNPFFNDIAVSGNYAFVSSETSGGGRGLYMFDISNPSSPTAVSTSFTLGYAGYGLALRGDTLYVLTSDSSAELKAYDVINPLSPTLLVGKDLPGSGAAKALFIDGTTVYVGATGVGPMSTAGSKNDTIVDHPWSIPKAIAKDYCYNESGSIVTCTSSSSSTSAGTGTPSPNGNDFLAFDISNARVISYLGSVYAQGVNGIAVSGTSAYLATPLDTAELRVVDVTNPAIMTFANGSVNGGQSGSYNLNDRTLDGLTVGISGTAALIGTQHGGAVQELVALFTNWNGVPLSSPGPWYYYGSGSVVKTHIDPTGCYAFVATTWPTKAVQVVKFGDRSMNQLQSIGFSSPANQGARGMTYDPADDLLYVVNQKGFFILKPGAPPTSC